MANGICLIKLLFPPFLPPNAASGWCSSVCLGCKLIPNAAASAPRHGVPDTEPYREISWIQSVDTNKGGKKGGRWSAGPVKK